LDLPTGTCCLEGKDAQESRPSSIADTLRKVMVLEQVGRLQVLMINGIVVADQSERDFMLEVLPLPPYFLMRLGE
jgi:uncharacterized protein (DUF427 family)